METLLLEKQDIQFVGMQPKSNFVFSAMHYRAEKNIYNTTFFNYLLNNNLLIHKYSVDKIKYLTFTFLIFPIDYKGVKREERKYFKRTEKHFFMDIEIPYQAFCDSDSKTALQILANNTLRCITKFLESFKNFDYQLFYKDVKNLFENEKII